MLSLRKEPTCSETDMAIVASTEDHRYALLRWKVQRIPTQGVVICDELYKREMHVHEHETVTS